MNKRNYQKELDKIIQVQQENGVMPRLLLHSCCAPCSSYCIEYLAQYFEITLLYYNPNISPCEEYEKRVAELKRLVAEMEDKNAFPKGRVRVMEGRYEPEIFAKISQGLELAKEGGSRCYKCYEMRMREAAVYAKENEFDYFTTTLSISPLKNPVWINEIGEKLAAEYGIMHLPSEFKKRGGYLRSIELSREYDLYRQNFCGCIFSQREAMEREMAASKSMEDLDK